LEQSWKKVFTKQQLKNLSDLTRNYWKSSRATLDFLLLYQDESLMGWVSILPWSTYLHLCRFKGTHWTWRERKSYAIPNGIEWILLHNTRVDPDDESTPWHTTSLWSYSLTWMENGCSKSSRYRDEFSCNAGKAKPNILVI
jgi:hypothetical protein